MKNNIKSSVTATGLVISAFTNNIEKTENISKCTLYNDLYISSKNLLLINTNTT